MHALPRGRSHIFKQDAVVGNSILKRETFRGFRFGEPVTLLAATRHDKRIDGAVKPQIDSRDQSTFQLR